jgi:hypothetical protein
VCFPPQIARISGKTLNVAILKNPLRCNLPHIVVAAGSKTASGKSTQCSMLQGWSSSSLALDED